MLNKKQEQKGKKGSTNNQAGRDLTVYQGITYTDAKEIAMDVFRHNFLQLSQDAAALAIQRAQKLLDDFLRKLKEENPLAIQNFQDPDMQVALYTAQKAYARSGVSQMEEILVNLLFERIIENNASFERIILNECIEMISKLTLDQLDLLGTVYVTKSTYKYTIKTHQDFSEFFASILVNIFSSQFSEIDGQYLVYTGCASINNNHLDLVNLLRERYLKAFSKGFTRSETTYLSDHLNKLNIARNNTGLSTKLTLSDLIEPFNEVDDDLYRFKFLNRMELETFLGVVPFRQDFIFSFERFGQTDSNIFDSFFSDSVGIEINSKWVSAKIGHLVLTPVGEKIAQIHLKGKFKNSYIPKDFKRLVF